MILTGVVELFGHYPPDVVSRATGVFGLPGKYKFMPRIAEIKAFLEEEMAPLRRAEERRHHLSLPEPPLDRSGRLTYTELKAKYGDGSGGWGVDIVSKKPSPFRQPKPGGYPEDREIKVSPHLIKALKEYLIQALKEREQIEEK